MLLINIHSQVTMLFVRPIRNKAMQHILKQDASVANWAIDENFPIKVGWVVGCSVLVILSATLAIVLRPKFGATYSKLTCTICAVVVVPSIVSSALGSVAFALLQKHQRQLLQEHPSLKLKAQLVQFFASDEDDIRKKLEQETDSEILYRAVMLFTDMTDKCRDMWRINQTNEENLRKLSLEDVTKHIEDAIDDFMGCLTSMTDKDKRLNELRFMHINQTRQCLLSSEQYNRARTRYDEATPAQQDPLSELSNETWQYRFNRFKQHKKLEDINQSLLIHNDSLQIANKCNEKSLRSLHTMIYCHIQMRLGDNSNISNNMAYSIKCMDNVSMVMGNRADSIVNKIKNQLCPALQELKKYIKTNQANYAHNEDNIKQETIQRFNSIKENFKAICPKGTIEDIFNI